MVELKDGHGHCGTGTELPKSMVHVVVRRASDDAILYAKEVDMAPPRPFVRVE